jgi:hypothetical protein
MATAEDLLAAIKHVNDCSGDPQAWLTGLTPQDVTDVATVFLATPERLDALLGKIHRGHQDLFDPTTGAMTGPRVPRPGGAPVTAPPAEQRPTDHQEGDAADAIRSAESALAQQNSSTAQLDLQVVSAILNAHLKAVDGNEALSQLQREIESAVRTRTDLDTAAGARDFQRFLLGKVQDIRAVVAGASLDDTSKSALMAALTSLYNIPQDGQPAPAHDGAPPTVGAATPSVTESAETQDDDADEDADPYWDSATGDEDADVFPAGSTTQAPVPTPAAVPNLPAAAGFPPLGGAALPGPMPGWGAASGSSIPDLLQALGKRGPTDDELEDAARTDENAGFDDDSDGDSDRDDDADEDGEDGQDGEGDDDDAVQPAGPTQVTLPNGETITAANAKLAAAIEAAVNGTPIADAFRDQGMTIPPPGTAVTERIDPPQLSPGDIGMFTDHHALSLGPSEALVNGQIQHISTVQGPSFLGWEHPPAAPAAAPTKTEPPTPTPTRPAALTAT